MYIPPSSQCHISLDIETFGTKPGCKIIEIGMARMFTESRNTFTIPIDSSDEAQPGLVEDIDTVVWWATQSIPRPDTLAKGLNLRNALEFMYDWIIQEVLDSNLEGTVNETEAIKSVYIWAKSPSFDCAILKYAFEIAGVKVPWIFRNERDVRTAIAMSNYYEYLIDFIGTPHIALDDAVHQAKIVEECYRRLDLL